MQRELSRLKCSGLVSVERIANREHYRANPNSPISAELKSLVLKTVALAEPLKRSLAPFADQIDSAFIYGSVAEGTDRASDIDLMVIGNDLDQVGLYGALQDARETTVAEGQPDISFAGRLEAKGRRKGFCPTQDFRFWRGGRCSAMGTQELDNLVKIGPLKVEPPTRSEYAGMVASARKRLVDAAKRRPGPRQPVRSRLRSRPQASARGPSLRRLSFRRSHHGVAHTLATERSHIQTFLKAYNERNLAEYQDRTEIDAKLLADLLRSTNALETEVGKLAPPAED